MSIPYLLLFFLLLPFIFKIVKFMIAVWLTLVLIGFIFLVHSANILWVVH